jgi:hypothetical protein
MGEETYMNKPYCLECGVKHSRDAEHHLGDLVTASKDDPEMREKAQELLDKQRDIRREIDNLRIEERAKKILTEKTL